jgi:hypothetical protein
MEDLTSQDSRIVNFAENRAELSIALQGNTYQSFWPANPRQCAYALTSSHFKLLLELSDTMICGPFHARVRMETMRLMDYRKRKMLKAFEDTWQHY